jgi:hypothetical protein
VLLSLSLSLSLMWTVHETMLFEQNTLFHLKEKRRQNVLIFESVIHFWFVQSSPQLQFWF